MNTVNVERRKYYDYDSCDETSIGSSRPGSPSSDSDEMPETVAAAAGHQHRRNDGENDGGDGDDDDEAEASVARVREGGEEMGGREGERADALEDWEREPVPGLICTTRRTTTTTPPPPRVGDVDEAHAGSVSETTRDRRPGSTNARRTSPTRKSSSSSRSLANGGGHGGGVLENVLISSRLEVNLVRSSAHSSLLLRVLLLDRRCLDRRTIYLYRIILALQVYKHGCRSVTLRSSRRWTRRMRARHYIVCAPLRPGY